MKGFTKILALILACLLLVTGLVACCGETDTETKPQGTETKAPETSGSEGGRYDASFDRSTVSDTSPQTSSLRARPSPSSSATTRSSGSMRWTWMRS